MLFGAQEKFAVGDCDGGVHEAVVKRVDGEKFVGGRGFEHEHISALVVDVEVFAGKDHGGPALRARSSAREALFPDGFAVGESDALGGARGVKDVEVSPMDDAAADALFVAEFVPEAFACDVARSARVNGDGTSAVAA